MHEGKGNLRKRVLSKQLDTKMSNKLAFFPTDILTAGEDILFPCLTCIRWVRIKTFTTRDIEKNMKNREGKKRERETRDSNTKCLYNWHYQSIITVIRERARGL